MKRPWHVALAFGGCLVLLLAAIVWLSTTVLRLERAEQAARREAALEESMRLALWRMDSALSALIAQERARPYFMYRPFYPAEAAYTQMFAQPEVREVWIASPLLAPDSEFVRLYFQFVPNGRLTSPQVPEERQLELAVPAYVSAEELDAAAADLASLTHGLQREQLVAALPAVTAPAPSVVRDPRTAQAPSGHGSVPLQRPEQVQSEQQLEQTQSQEGENESQRADYKGMSQIALNAREFAARHQQLQAMPIQQQRQMSNTPEFLDTAPNVAEGPFVPLWADGRLLLARRILIGDDEYVQGCWMNWEALRPWLLSLVADLLAEADLEPAADAPADSAERRLAGLPLRLVGGRPLAAAVVPAAPLWPMLSAAWACVLVAAVAVAALLIGAIVLSERRAAFVSAVTHELRTPLTTFRLYTDMLAGGLVADENQRRAYLSVLAAEASRLGHLVENVLAYARLERRNLPARAEPIACDALIERLAGRLLERAAEARMTIEVDCTEVQGLRVRADVGAVEQILFNLVDNACKYASRAQDRRIILSARGTKRAAILSVTDHGPGLDGVRRGRLFRPFEKSATDAANSAPGVGLGLALSRRLARAMQGDLHYVGGPTGARFDLSLPLADG